MASDQFGNDVHAGDGDLQKAIAENFVASVKKQALLAVLIEQTTCCFFILKYSLKFAFSKGTPLTFAP